MKDNFTKAFESLKEIGAPVIAGGDNGGDDSFRIAGDDNHTKVWADYWQPELGRFGVCDDITDILDAHGLWAEWVNPGVLQIYED